MKRVFYLLIPTMLFLACDPADLSKAMGQVMGEEPTKVEIGQGLKQALEIGIAEGAERLSQVDGYYASIYKILLPEEAEKVVNKLSMVPGFQDLEQDLILKINRAAEDAAKSAKPIFVDAIRGMTFQDATDILMGPNNAATTYLHDKTNAHLYDAFKPVITESLNKFGVLDLWSDAISAHNKLPFVKKVNPDMADHITNKALTGLFSMVEKEEIAIRKNPAKRVTDLLKRVFKMQDKK
jgi:hypothetical protein